MTYVQVGRGGNFREWRHLDERSGSRNCRTSGRAVQKRKLYIAVLKTFLTILRKWQCDYCDHCPSIDSRHIGRCTLGDRQRGSCLQRLLQRTGQTQSQNNGNPVFSNLSHKSQSWELFKLFAIFHKPGCQNISFQPVERWKPCKGRQKGISWYAYLSLMKK